MTLITSAKTLFPNKVTQALGGPAFGVWGWDTTQPSAVTDFCALLSGG